MKIYPVTLIAEKPSQLRAYLSVVSAQDYKKVESFHYEIAPCQAFPEGANAVSCRGFLLALMDPKEYPGLEHLERWSIDDIPFPIPRPYKYVPGNGSGVKQQLEHIKGVIRQSVNQYGIEQVMMITATDCDDAGALIAQQIYDYSFSKEEWKKVKKKTLLINSLERTEVFKGLLNLRNYELTSRMAESCRAKQASDWALGLSLTRLVTILSKEKVHEAIERLNKGTAALYNVGIPKQSIGISVEDIFPRDSAARIGRVASVITHFIYNRENEILNFKPHDFHEVYADFNSPDGAYRGKLQGFKSYEMNEVNQLLMQHRIKNGEAYTAIISDVKTEKKKKSAPPLHSLTSLQALANKKWKMSAKQVLEHVQNLYEQKLCSYPRSACKFITTAEFQYLSENVEKYKEALGLEFETVFTAPRKRYVQNENVAEHHAIILTRNVCTLSQSESLSDGERNIYMEIARSTLALFAPDYEFDQTSVITTINQLPFLSIGKIERARGYEKLWDGEKKTNLIIKKVDANIDEQDENQTLPPLVKDQQVKGVVEVKSGKTTAPQRYTEAMLLEAMENAGKFIEDEESRAILKEAKGIGTPATRADIIASIKEAKYVVVEKNRFIPTPKAMVVCRMTKGTMLSNPEITAKWETYLNNISRGVGNANADAFIERNIEFIQHFKDAFIERIEQLAMQQYVESVVIQVNSQVQESRIVCPKCKSGEIQLSQGKNQKASFYSCSSYKSEHPCGFTMNANYYGNKLTSAQLIQLLTKGITSREVKLKSKEGKEYKAKIRLNETFKMEAVSNEQTVKRTQKQKG